MLAAAGENAGIRHGERCDAEPEPAFAASHGERHADTLYSLDWRSSQIVNIHCSDARGKHCCFTESALIY